MKSHQKSHRGFTLVEVLLVIVIIALLITISQPIYSYLRGKASQAVCMANLKLIGLGLNIYMQDHEMVWPQMPTEPFARDEDESAWWEATLKPYGVDRKHWKCPTDQDSLKNSGKEANNDEFVSSYLVTQFDEFPNTAFRWSEQPWVMEAGAPHGTKNGTNLLMADGSIVPGLPLPSPE